MHSTILIIPVDKKSDSYGYEKRKLRYSQVLITPKQLGTYNYGLDKVVKWDGISYSRKREKDFAVYSDEKKDLFMGPPHSWFLLSVKGKEDKLYVIENDLNCTIEIWKEDAFKPLACHNNYEITLALDAPRPPTQSVEENLLVGITADPNASNTKTNLIFNFLSVNFDKKNFEEKGKFELELSIPPQCCIIGAIHFSSKLLLVYLRAWDVDKSGSLVLVDLAEKKLLKLETGFSKSGFMLKLDSDSFLLSSETGIDIYQFDSSKNDWKVIQKITPTSKNWLQEYHMVAVGNLIT
jgi:hypothetical protein